MEERRHVQFPLLKSHPHHLGKMKSCFLPEVMEIIHMSLYIYDLCMCVLKPIAPFLMIWSKQKEENRKVFFLLLEHRETTEL